MHTTQSINSGLCTQIVQAADVSSTAPADRGGSLQCTCLLVMGIRCICYFLQAVPMWMYTPSGEVKVGHQTVAVSLVPQLEVAEQRRHIMLIAEALSPPAVILIHILTRIKQGHRLLSFRQSSSNMSSCTTIPPTLWCFSGKLSMRVPISDTPIFQFACLTLYLNASIISN